jgi:hypothetical protein
LNFVIARRPKADEAIQLRGLIWLCYWIASPLRGSQ